MEEQLESGDYHNAAGARCSHDRRLCRVVDDLKHDRRQGWYVGSKRSLASGWNRRDDGVEGATLVKFVKRYDVDLESQSWTESTQTVSPLWRPCRNRHRMGTQLADCGK